MSEPTHRSIAYFVSSHGFGHATRACAVMEAFQRRWPRLCFEIFTATPRWIFTESLDAPFGYHKGWTDIGLVQENALEVDIPATLQRLEAFLPFSPERVQALARRVRAAGCTAVLCDIAPLGIAVARAAGVPSVLVENFTWDWIYAGYTQEWPTLRPYIDYLAEQFAHADVHIQTEPVCRFDPDRPADRVVAPVSRSPRGAPIDVRRRLGIPEDAPMVLVTMGGMAWEYRSLARLARLSHVHFVLPGDHRPEDAPANAHVLSPRSGLFHPDLVAASDAVIGKIGYSTLAEVHRAGVPYGYVSRSGFRESAVLAAFVEEHMSGLAIDSERFADGSWTDVVPDLLTLPRRRPPQEDGAVQIAEWLWGRVGFL